MYETHTMTGRSLFEMSIFLDITQFFFFFLILTLSVKPLGRYMAKVFNGERTFLSPFLSPVEHKIYDLAGIDQREMGWKEYALSMLIFNFIGFVVLLLILIFQGVLPLNPQKFPGLSWHLAFNTTISYITNTNWQAYSGESTMSYLSQMMGLSVQNFFSAATGLTIAIALVRGFVRKSAKTIGNFWVDLTRSVLYILLPISFVAAIVLVSQGVIQNFDAYKTIKLVQPIETEKATITTQTLPMGPIASQEAIKLLGTNGGGFLGANSAHPYENPNAFTNFLEAFLIVLIPAGLTYTFGYMVGRVKQGWSIYIVMLVLLLLFMGMQYYSLIKGNPLVSNLGVSGPYIEGQEVRFGIGGTTLFSSITTGVSCGAVNASLDSLPPIGGMCSMTLILLGEIVFGGIGSGLYTMLAFVIIAVFVAGLMIGRIPEFLGKKIEINEMVSSVVVVLVSGLIALLFTSIALITKAGTSSILNPGAHGISEVLYAYGSSANNNGSAFAGLNANTLFYNLTTAVAMLVGRFVPAVLVLFMAGSLAQKKHVPPSSGTLPTDNSTFMVWLIFVILIVGALSFFPAIALGPFVEDLIMWGVK